MNQGWFNPRHLQGIDKKAWVESETLGAYTNFINLDHTDCLNIYQMLTYDM